MNVEKTSKVFKFLKEVHSETIFPKKVKIYDIAKRHQLGALASTILIKNKLVTFEGQSRKHRAYKWNTILPNVKMAEEFYKKYSEEVKISNTKSRTVSTKEKQSLNQVDIVFDTPITSTPLWVQNEVQVEAITPKAKRKYTRRTPQVVTTTVVEEPKKETRTFSFAWGLIKFNY